MIFMFVAFFFSSRRRHTRWPRDWSSDVCSSDLTAARMTTNKPPIMASRFSITRSIKDGGGGAERTTRVVSRTTGAEIGRASCRERDKGGEGGGQAQERRMSVRRERRTAHKS